MTTKAQRKSIKNNLQHLNGCYYVFKDYCLQRQFKEIDPVIQLMLKNYLQDDNKIIDEVEIERCTNLYKTKSTSVSIVPIEELSKIHKNLSE